MKRKTDPLDDALEYALRLREAEIRERFDVPVRIARKRISDWTVELKRCDEFETKHSSCKGECLINFYPGPIGTAIDIRCTGCGQEEDITDYDCW